MSKKPTDKKKHIHDGCALCGSPVLEDHTLCSRCEADQLTVKKRHVAEIYEFPTGRKLK
jgi:predicted amidophosphoribosyltransferase